MCRLHINSSNKWNKNSEKVTEGHRFKSVHWSDSLEDRSFGRLPMTETYRLSFQDLFKVSIAILTVWTYLEWNSVASLRKRRPGWVSTTSCMSGTRSSGTRWDRDPAVSSHTNWAASSWLPLPANLSPRHAHLQLLVALNDVIACKRYPKSFLPCDVMPAQTGSGWFWSYVCL